MPLSDINRLSATELARLIAQREISPVDATRAALERLAETEPHLNAFTAVDAEGALRAARDAEVAMVRGGRVGPLHGVPVSVKDLIDVAGLPARYGSLTLKNDIAPEDAPSVARLRAAGAIIIGKTATSEFGYRGYTKSLVHGTTRNPRDLGRTPGGSSGGAVASVAAGVTPIALGTDGGGSIRAPCAFTGLVGIKANFGRVPVWPASATPTLAHVGPIARTVDDAALLLRAVAGPDPRDPFSLLPPFTPNDEAPALHGLRAAFSPTLGYGKVDQEVLDVVVAAVERLRSSFAALETVSELFPDPAEILAAEFIGGCSARLGDLVETRPELIDPPLLDAIRQFRSMSADSYTRLLRRRLEHRERVWRLFERYDVLLTPTTPCVAWPIELPVPPGHETAAVWSYFTYPFNLTGQPAASLPCGITGAGLPVGLQIVAPLCAEPVLLHVLRSVELLLGQDASEPCDVLIDNPACFRSDSG